MLHLILFVFVFMGLLCLSMCVAGGVAVYGYLQLRRRVQLIELTAYHKRLESVVAGLLTRADEIDQEHRYGSDSQMPVWSRRLGETCNELVVLGDALGTIEMHIKRRELREGRAVLLSSVRVAVKISRQLGEIQRTARAVPETTLKLPQQESGS